MNYMLSKFTETTLEKAIIEMFEQQGYDYADGEKLHRKYEDILILDDLREYLLNRYEKEHISETEMKKIINKLHLISSSPLYNGNRETFRLLNEGFDLVRDDVSKVALHIDYINFDEPEKNLFKVINQYSVQGEHIRRPDMLVFINGIPVAIFEFKSAVRENVTIFDAWKQITIRYCRDIPNLMRYCMLSVISDGANTKLGSIFTPYEYYYSWNKVNDTEKVSNGISSLFTMIKGAFSKERIIAILRDFVFYPDDSKKDEAIVCRYPQFFAANKLLENIKQHMKPYKDGKGGTYFGATGCGKTYTMLFLARLIALRDSDTFQNPTIIIITDREDLDTQTAELFVTAKKYLHEEDVRSIENRRDMLDTLKDKPSGGVYITTIQKFCETTGLLSDRNNIICMSDEAHRTQVGIGSKLEEDENGVHTTYGFAHYLRCSFPNATYCAFSGTPIDATFAVFGGEVDRYTMKEACDDEITVRIAYEPRLARVVLSDEQAKIIEKYYQDCAAEGSSEEQIERSKKAMSQMKVILKHPERIKKLAKDIVEHYETLCSEKPEVVQKAMIVCAGRHIAYDLIREITDIRKDWAEPVKSPDEENLSKEQLDKLVPLPKINLVATRRDDDEKALYEMCGSKDYRKMLDKQFKNIHSNFQIAVVVDMWITGFDVPSLSVMYIDKPLKKHTLVQTISRVNRVFEGKDKGLVVDYIGFKQDMMEAVKQYGDKNENPVDELKISLDIFRNHLSLIDDLFCKFNFKAFFEGTPMEKLNCLNEAAEYIQRSQDMQLRFMGLSKRLKSAYMICYPSGELTDIETEKAQFYMAVRSIIYKQTKGHVPDAEMMNRVVESMVQRAVSCTGVEDIVNENKSVDLFSEEFLAELDKVKLPITKFNALLKLVRKAITEYGKTNKIKALEFDERLRRVVDEYNTRDNFVFTSEVMSDFVNSLSDKLLEIMNDLNEDKTSFEKLGMSYEEKVFYDILVKVRDDHKFDYADDKCLILAKNIKDLVDDKSKFADWSTRNDIKNKLNMDLTVLLYKSGYPPEWDEEVFEKIMEQAENFKIYSFD